MYKLFSCDFLTFIIFKMIKDHQKITKIHQNFLTFASGHSDPVSHFKSLFFYFDIWETCFLGHWDFFSFSCSTTSGQWDRMNVQTYFQSVFLFFCYIQWLASRLAVESRAKPTAELTRDLPLLCFLLCTNETTLELEVFSFPPLCKNQQGVC